MACGGGFRKHTAFQKALQLGINTGRKVAGGVRTAASRPGDRDPERRRATGWRAFARTWQLARRRAPPSGPPAAAGSFVEGSGRRGRPERGARGGSEEASAAPAPGAAAPAQSRPPARRGPRMRVAPRRARRPGAPMACPGEARPAAPRPPGTAAARPGPCILTMLEVGKSGKTFIR